jgi:hypothetical protein
MLRAVGRPLNDVARTRHLEQGDPIYFVTHLPYQQLYPLLTGQIIDESAFAATWSKACATVESFYADATELQDKPIWAIDELAVNSRRDAMVDAYVTDHPDVIPCYLDRASGRKDIVQLHVNRTLAAEQGMVTRTDSPSLLAGRPGTPPIPEQVRAIAKTCAERGSSSLLLADSGFASGNSILQLCNLFEQAGLEVVKVMGSIGSTKSREVLKDYDPECCIWFDLQQSGWVESRDFFMFLNNGTPIAAKADESGTYNIAIKPLSNGTPLGFAVPYCAYGGRWFRLGSEEQIKQLVSRCFTYTQHLYDSVKQGVTIAELAELHADQDQTFLLPVTFGDLDAQYQAIDENMTINSYLDQHFKQFIA